MASAAYAIVGSEVDVGVAVQAADELRTVVAGVVAHKTVQFLWEIILAECINDDRSLRSASMVAKKVAKSNKYIALLKVCIYSSDRRWNAVRYSLALSDSATLKLIAAYWLVRIASLVASVADCRCQIVMQPDRI
jgi:hypothetical protein